MALPNLPTKLTITEMKRQCGMTEGVLDLWTREAVESLASGTFQVNSRLEC